MKSFIPETIKKIGESIATIAGGFVSGIGIAGYFGKGYEVYKHAEPMYKKYVRGSIGLYEDFYEQKSFFAANPAGEGTSQIIRPIDPNEKTTTRIECSKDNPEPGLILTKSNPCS